MIREINSVDNPLIKRVTKLKQRKYRDKEGKFICSGFNILSEAIAQKQNIDIVLIRHDIKEHDIVGECVRNNIDIAILNRECFEKISDTESTQGIMAIVTKPRLEPLNMHKNSYVIIEELQDPGNLGTIIRTAEAAGFTQIVMVKGTVDVFSPKVIRACAGAVFRMPISFENTVKDAIDYVKEKGAKALVTKVDEGIPYYNLNIADNVAILVGNEGNGVSQTAAEMADEVLNIPMSGKAESLNVGVASSIIMFESYRQHVVKYEK